MARIDTLPHFLTDVADAIREKGGTSEPIQASDFDTEIENLPSGGGADLSDYFTPTIGFGSSGYPGFVRMLKKIPDTTIVEGTSLSYAFYGYYGTTIPLIDTSNVTGMSDLFNNCYNLTTIPLLDTSKAITFVNIFYNCINLTTVPLLNTSKVGNFNNAFYNCSNLTDTSLDNILQMCIGATSYSGTKTLSKLGFKATNYSKSRIEALPHYQDFIDAGWTIGY